MQNIIRVLLFVLFFSIGSAAFSISILSGEVLRYYEGVAALKAEQQYTEVLKSLIADYDAILQRERDDPNFIKTIASAALEKKPDDACDVYPRATDELLAAADEVLKAEHGRERSEQGVPGWVARCNSQPQRIILFVSGACLVLVSFIWFGSAEPKDVQR